MTQPGMQPNGLMYKRLRRFYLVSLLVALTVGVGATLAYQQMFATHSTVYATSDSPDKPLRCVVREEVQPPATQCPVYIFSLHVKPGVGSADAYGPMSGSVYRFGRDSLNLGRVSFRWSGSQVAISFLDYPELGELIGAERPEGQEWHWNRGATSRPTSAPD